MNASRRVAALAGTAGWLYSWYVIRGLRAFFSPERGVGIPGWLVALMAFSSTILLGCAIGSTMQVKLWAPLSLSSGIALAGLIFLGQYAVMEAASFGDTVSPEEAVSQALKDRNPIMTAAVPTLLVLAGATGMLGPGFARGGRQPGK